MTLYTLWSTAHNRCVRTEVRTAALLFFNARNASIRAMELKGSAGLGEVLPIPALLAAGYEAADTLPTDARETAYLLRDDEYRKYIDANAINQGPIERREPPSGYKYPAHANKRIAGVPMYPNIRTS